MSTDTFHHETAVFGFTTLAAAAEALLVVLEDARTTKTFYTFTGLTPSRILKDGLTLEGDVADIRGRVDRIDGAVRRSV